LNLLHFNMLEPNYFQRDFFLTSCIFITTVTVDVFFCIQLEKALKETQVEESEVRQAADKQLAQARELVASIEERSVQADLKLAQVQVVRADANRKLQESEHRLQEVEAREVALRRERHSLMAEYVTSTFSSLRLHSICSWLTGLMFFLSVLSS